MKVRTIFGLLIMIVGILLIVYGAFLLVQDGPGGFVPRIIGNDAVIGLAGGVIFIIGVVVQGFKRIIALIVHLVALIPYYLAISQIQTLGMQGNANESTYLTQTELYWAAAIILGIIGVTLNRTGRKKKPEGAPSAPQSQPQPPMKQ